jgi:class 3 adenylate cyclase
MQTGVLVFASLKKNGFSQERIRILSRMYTQAAILIHNALIFSEIKQLEEKTRRIFEMYVPPEVIKNFLGSGDEALLSGEKRKVAILFSDIRSFTSLSEKMPPEKVVSMLNSYFSRMVAGITASRGTIDKFIGDAILAIFGAPKQTPNNSYYAVLAALEMHTRLAELNHDNERIGIPELHIGIGIHFGDAIVGNIGSAEKMDYTVIGDSVNLASRLEGLTKYYGVGIIVSEDVARAIDDYADSILVLEIDVVRVKGKNKPTVIFTVFDRSKLSDILKESIGTFQKGYSLYRLGSFAEALDNFEKMTDEMPVKYLYMKRCAQFMETPPTVWDGVYDMQSK